jgi:hypothetical protein
MRMVRPNDSGEAALVVAGANDMMNTNSAFAVREVSEKVVWVLKDLRKLFHLLKSFIIVNRKPSTNGWLSRCTGTIGHASNLRQHFHSTP